tara:strand:- start:11 stop:199 length:189 start_codon:yes stop_codon:yes gene_type:complete
MVELFPAPSPKITSLVLILKALNEPETVNEPVIEASPTKGKGETLGAYEEESDINEYEEVVA